jgi:hypothetical protein
LPPDQFHIERGIEGSKRLSNTSTTSSLVALEGLDIRNGAVEFDIQPVNASCEVGLSSASGKDATRYIHVKECGKWNSIRLRWASDGVTIGVNGKFASVQSYSAAPDMFRPYVLVKPGRTVEVRNIKQHSASLPAAPALPPSNEVLLLPSSLVGDWLITYSNNVTRVYRIGNNGEVMYSEDRKVRGGQVKHLPENRTGKVTMKDGQMFLEFPGDGKIERLTAQPDGRLRVEHWDPAAKFPASAPLIGLGVRGK